MADGVLVFDDQPVLTSTLGGQAESYLVLDETSDVLVFDSQVSLNVVQSGSSETDFVVFEAQATVTETVVAPADFLLVEAPKEPARVVLEGSDEDVLVLTPGGPPGPPGSPGPQGPQGIPGADGPGAYYQEFGFASPSTTWTIVHNQNSLGLTVEAVDTNGDPIEGYVRNLDTNTIEVDWYYPTAGTARVFR